MKKSLLSFLLCLVMLSGLLTACVMEAPQQPLDSQTQDSSDSLHSDSIGSEPNDSTESSDSTESTESTPPPFAPEEGIYINEVNVCDYRIVIPKDCDLSTKYAALNLSDYLWMYFGIQLETVTDDASEQEYEFLIGDTNRSASKIQSELAAGQYVLMQKRGKVVMQGEGIYVGAGVGYFVSHYLRDLKPTGGINIADLPATEIPTAYKFRNRCSNVILMIGDGMGFNHINMALANGLSTFDAQQLPYHGEVRTASLSGVTDSAAAATAMSAGYKTHNGYLGMDGAGNRIQNVRELAYEDGAKTAIVSSTVITDATPAGFLAHNKQRDDTANIQKEINQLQAEGKIDYFAGDTGDRLTLETRKALMTIAHRKESFFLMSEGAYIDKYSHGNAYDTTLHSVKRFNDAVSYVIQFVFCHPNTALIVTADHETGGLVEAPGTTYGYKYTSGNHTGANVPIYAMGPETEDFLNGTIENIDIAKFIAKIYGNENFGQKK